MHLNGAGPDFNAPFGGYRQSGNGRDISNANNAGRPQIVTNGPGIIPNVPSLFFPTATGLFTTTAGLTPFGFTGRTVFVVSYASTVGNYDIFTDRGSTTFAAHAIPFGGAGFAYTDGVNIPNNSTVTSGPSLSVLHVVTWDETAPGVSLNFYVDGLLSTSSQPSGMSTQTGTMAITVGDGPSALGIFNTYISEVICYARQLSVSERAQVTAYLKTRYGIV